MTKRGDAVKCPKCGGESHVVWVSPDGKLAAIKCMRPHSQINPASAETSSNVQTKKKTGMVFLVDVS